MGAGRGTGRASAAPPIRRLAIVIRDDAFDRLLTPLTFAWEMGRKGVEVDILFVLWSVRLLTHEGVRECRMDPRYAHREDWLKQRLQRDGDPLEIHDFLKLLASTGHVRLHGCRLAAMTFDVAEDDLCPRRKGSWIRVSFSRRSPRGRIIASTSDLNRAQRGMGCFWMGLAPADSTIVGAGAV
jgi:peroxiredoxin family protein